MSQEGGWSQRAGTWTEAVLSPTGPAVFSDPRLTAHLHQYQLGRRPLHGLLPHSGECAGLRVPGLSHTDPVLGPSPRTSQQHPHFVKISPRPGTLQRVPAPLSRWKEGACREETRSCKCIAKKITRRGQGQCPGRPECLRCLLRRERMWETWRGEGRRASKKRRGLCRPDQKSRGHYCSGGLPLN